MIYNILFINVHWIIVNTFCFIVFVYCLLFIVITNNYLVFVYIFWAYKIHSVIENGKVYMKNKLKEFGIAAFLIIEIILCLFDKCF